jgi:hypothetical protein
MHSLEPDHLAAGAEEDRAALSGRPRKANAGQYDGVMHQDQYAGAMPQRTKPRQFPPNVIPTSNHASI